MLTHIEVSEYCLYLPDWLNVVCPLSDWGKPCCRCQQQQQQHECIELSTAFTRGTLSLRSPTLSGTWKYSFFLSRFTVPDLLALYCGLSPDIANIHTLTYNVNASGLSWQHVARSRRTRLVRFLWYRSAYICISLKRKSTNGLMT